MMFLDLDSFLPVSLARLDDLKLMDRVDRKYLLPVDLLPGMLHELRGVYNALEIGGARSFCYETLYYDTPGLLLLNQHLTGKMPRYKVRERFYVSTGGSFLEVKRKVSNGKTTKWRIAGEYPFSGIGDELRGFVDAQAPVVKGEVLSPTLVTRFTRFTLAGFASGERVTIDRELSFTDPSSGKSAYLPYLAIVEVKRNPGSIMSPVTAWLASNNVHPTGFSKYCAGCGLLRDFPKRGLVKYKLRMINKIRYKNDRHYDHYEHVAL